MLRNQGRSRLPRMMSVANSGRRCDPERFCRELWGYRMLRPETHVSVRLWPWRVIAGSPPIGMFLPRPGAVVSGVRGEGACTQETGRSGLIPELCTATQRPTLSRVLPVSLRICSFASFFLFLLGFIYFFRAVLRSQRD